MIWVKRAEKILSDVYRALPISSVFNALYSEIDNDDDYDYPYIIGEYVNENGNYIVFTDMGRLYKVSYSVSGVEVSFSEISEVIVEHTEVSRMNTTLSRSADGTLRFMGIASTATINRVGQIDSTLLYDDMVSRYDGEDDPQPINLHHKQETKYNLGLVRGIERKGNVFVIWGDIDESTFLGKYVEKRFAKGDYGLSIEFVPEEYETLDIDGINIRAYTKGFFVGVAALPETSAASHMTNVGSSRKVVRGMADSALKALLIDFTDDEDAVDDFLSDIDTTEREIKENNMITRDKEDANVEDGVEVEEEAVEEEAVDVEDIAEEVEEDEDVEEDEFVLDDEAVDDIANRAASIVLESINELKESLGESLTAIRSQIKEISEATEIIEDTQDELIPRSRRKRVKLSRPSKEREVVKETEEDEEEELSPAELRDRNFEYMKSQFGKNGEEPKKFE